MSCFAQAARALIRERRFADEAVAKSHERAEPRFERRSLAIELVTVKRQTRLHPQGVTRAKAAWLKSGGRTGGADRLEQTVRAIGAGEQLEAIFARVSGPRDQTFDPRDFAVGDAKAAEPAELDTRQRREDRLGAAVPGSRSAPSRR